MQVKAILMGAVLGVASIPTFAHFLVVYTPQTALVRATDLPFHLIFTHAFHGGPTMPLEKPQRFYYAKRNAPGEMIEEVDLGEYLQPIQWASANGPASAWKADVPRNVVRSLGDYQIVVEPTPYLEEAEDLYIQQFAKVIVNVGGVPGNWNETVGLPAEIHALNKSYANWTGGIFRGVVLGDGLPMPYTQVEVEYLNHDLDTATNAFVPEGKITAPHPSLEAIVILTDANGQFAFTLPKAGWWGFAALSVGPQTEHNGKRLSQDAILWVQATDLPQ